MTVLINLFVCLSLLKPRPSWTVLEDTKAVPDLVLFFGEWLDGNVADVDVPECGSSRAVMTLEKAHAPLVTK